MARKRQLRRWIASIVFIVAVAVSGYALAASGNLQSPLNAVTQVTQLLSGTSAAQGGETRSAPPAGETRGTPPSGDFAGGGDQSGLQWNRIGGVLYSAWVIAAVSALVMVVGPMIGWSIKQFQRGVRRLTPARAPALHKAGA